MEPKLKVFRGDGAFGRASSAKNEDQMVCGTYEPGGAPVYFLTPADTDDLGVEALAFQIREGREIGPAEHEFKAAALRLHRSA